MAKIMGLQMWEEATESLKDVFVDKYFGGDVSDVYWIADDIGGCLAVNDYFFNLSDIVDFIKYGYSKNKMFAYYDERLNHQMKNEDKDIPFINIKNYIRLKNKK